MNKLDTGEFYGTHYPKTAFADIIITDTVYTRSKVDWHYHENPCFTYLLHGKVLESSKKKSYYLASLSLLFRNWQDPHYNIKPPEYTIGFHIELNENWLLNNDFQILDFGGSINIQNPLTKNLINKVFLESKINEDYSNLGIKSLLIDFFSTMNENTKISTAKPDWVNKLLKLLMEEQRDYSLNTLSYILGIHPIYSSR